MIKLNNKNITYVALADSNNSVKGVKEIWYADSANSVKLVYRRKDALIEGEDYEKYHWLKGDGSAVINTNIEDITNLTELYCYFYSDNPSVSERIFGREGTSRVVLRYVSANNLEFFTSPSNNPPYITLGFNTEGYFYADFIANQASTSLSSPTNFIGNSNKIGDLGTIHLFGDKVASGPTSIVSAKIKSFIATPFVNLIPCKLLKPVPKWLDANGIRRQVGECGMIDLVSGKFYGNVNSVGTFSVENYYERKEWLVGDGNANIDGTLICTDYLEWKLAQYSGQYVALNYGELSDNSHQFQLSVNSNATNAIGVFFNDTRNYVSLSQQSVNDIKFLVNSQIIGIINNVNIENNNSNLKFNGKISLNLIAKSGGISKITVDNKERYIPCTLTMDLPASMDANNIARTKGTSGMWDLVSDRFYGNVANSGTFKAVNLAEGVDYEVHQWIIGDNVAYIDGLDYNLWTNTLEIKIGKVEGDCQYFGLKPVYDTQADNFPHFHMMSSGNLYRTYFRDFKTGQGWCGYFDTSNMPSEVVFSYYNENGKAVGIINGVKTYDSISTNTLTESVWNKYVPINSKDGNNIYTKLAKVSYIRELLPNNTYRSNLIPVKLLKSIPAKYDANGIARQAGECGMYDTVNDVFYGNVASSGTFTVSDDS